MYMQTEKEPTTAGQEEKDLQEGGEDVEKKKNSTLKKKDPAEEDPAAVKKKKKTLKRNDGQTIPLAGEDLTTSMQTENEPTMVLTFLMVFYNRSILQSVNS